jgi:hypothetical protein
MGRQCLTCEHPKRAQIELALARKVPFRVLMRRYGLSKDTLSRHKREHLPPQVVASLMATARPTGVDLDKLRESESEGLLQTIVYQRARLFTLLDQAEDMGDLRAAAQVHGRLTSNAEFTARLLGEINTAAQYTTNNILISDEYLALRAALVQALRPYPKARQAVAKVLQQREAQSVPERVIEHDHAGD